MRTAVVLSLSLSFNACQPQQPFVVPGGTQVWQMFPFDGEREWKYVSTDASLTYKLVANCDGLAERLNGKNVYTVRYTVECVTASETCVTGERVFTLRWSSDTTDGVFIHAYSLGEDPFIDFDPPLQITYDDMNFEEVIGTETGGSYWESTMGQIGECPLRMAVDFGSCGTWTVTSSVGDGYPIAGQWWAVEGAGITAFQLSTDTGVWELAQYDCEPDNECDGDW
jgi:hypothetical protein